MIQILIMLTVIFLMSVMLTGLIRGYVLRKNILDIPNDRSSHRIPTPRGGGISFVLLFNILSLWLMLQHHIPLSLFYALSGGIVIAAIGWLDDVLSIDPMWRMMIHTTMAIWVIYWLGGLPSVGAIVGYPLAVICIVWCINLYNFMDGIDGLAGVEGVFISLCAALMLSLLGISGISLLCLLLAGAIGGFLVWNWPPAKIFMGDVGSSYLGYIFSVLAIATANFDMLPLAFWIIIAAVFLCDTTFTVLYRIYNGEHWCEAHCKHAYQRLVQSGMNHRTVTMSIVFINIFILLPIAFTTFYYPTLYFKILSILLVGFFVLWFFIMDKDHLSG
ncbi:MAG TPA: glycosyltransferase family 4 protein [Gammaproteobacteria bacterium]|nr:glycosyltransferase family 4 protein [Gammaproteobacteria bacterium]